jgi:hypothetical protein
LTDWAYIDSIFNKHLQFKTLVKLFAEIAISAQDLKQAENMPFPNDIPMVIYNTNYEQKYIQTATQ